LLSILSTLLAVIGSIEPRSCFAASCGHPLQMPYLNCGLSNSWPLSLLVVVLSHRAVTTSGHIQPAGHVCLHRSASDMEQAPCVGPLDSVGWTTILGTGMFEGCKGQEQHEQLRGQPPFVLPGPAFSLAVSACSCFPRRLPRRSRSSSGTNGTRCPSRRTPCSGCLALCFGSCHVISLSLLDQWYCGHFVTVSIRRECCAPPLGGEPQYAASSLAVPCSQPTLCSQASTYWDRASFPTDRNPRTRLAE